MHTEITGSQVGPFSSSRASTICNCYNSLASSFSGSQFVFTFFCFVSVVSSVTGFQSLCLARKQIWDSFWFQPMVLILFGVRNFIHRWYVNETALIITLYIGGWSATKTSTILVTPPARTGSLIILRVIVFSPENPVSGFGVVVTSDRLISIRFMVSGKIT